MSLTGDGVGGVPEHGPVHLLVASAVGFRVLVGPPHARLGAPGSSWVE